MYADLTVKHRSILNSSANSQKTWTYKTALHSVFCSQGTCAKTLYKVYKSGSA